MMLQALLKALKKAPCHFADRWETYRSPLSSQFDVPHNQFNHLTRSRLTGVAC